MQIYNVVIHGFSDKNEAERLATDFEKKHGSWYVTVEEV